MLTVDRRAVLGQSSSSCFGATIALVFMGIVHPDLVWQYLCWNPRRRRIQHIALKYVRFVT
jgi:hypothetical protein